MNKYVFIGLGGFLGAISRYIIKNAHIVNYKEQVPINTLIINVTGSFILALILTVAFEIWEMNTDIRLGIAAGFLGAYTTFSTLCKEIVLLFDQGLYFSAISYVTVSTMLGLAAAYFGVVVAREVIGNYVKRLQQNKNPKGDEGVV